MPVDGVEAGVQQSAGEPAVEGLALRVDHIVPGLDPVDRLRGFGPEAVRIFQPTSIDIAVRAHTRSPPKSISIATRRRLADQGQPSYFFSRPATGTSSASEARRISVNR